MHNIENDKWFLSKVNDGTLLLTKDGKVYNNITKRYIGATGNGRYPKISMMYKKDKNGKKIIKHMLIHRLVWIVFNGLIPTGYEINHIDCNKENPNLDNLELVTKKQNMKHAFDNDLMSCRKGENNNASKLTEENVADIRKIYLNGNSSLRKLGKLYGVNKTTVYHIIKNKTWKHI